MQCANCGAPLELADGRTVLRCAYCNSTRRLAAADAGEGDRVLPLGRPANVACPCCLEDLMEAAVDGQPAKTCLTCHGVLLATAIFAEVTRKRRATYRGPELPPEPIHPEQLQRSVACPGCQSRMDVHPHYGPGRAVIDSCHRCNLVWLDHSELTLLERTPGLR